MMHEEETIFFNGEDWQKIKRWAAKRQGNLVDQLCNADRTHDESNRIRGALGFIKQLLALENDAAKASLRNS